MSVNPSVGTNTPTPHTVVTSPPSSKSCPKSRVKWFIGFLLVQAIFMLIYTRRNLQWNTSSIANPARGTGSGNQHQFHPQKQEKVKVNVREWDNRTAVAESFGNSGEPLKKGTPANPRKARKNHSKGVRKPMKIMKNKHADFKVEEDADIRNYMKNANRAFALPLLINTTHCKIPDFKPIDEETQPLLMEPLTPPDCPKFASRRSGSRWNSKIDGENRLIVIPTPDYEDPYKNGSGRENSIEHCCYQIITRATEDKMKEWNLRDFMVDLTPCAIIKPNVPTEIRAEFIKVECYNYTIYERFENGAKTNASSLVPKLRLEYREFHAIPTTHRNPRRARILKKQNFWTRITTRNSSFTSSGAPVPPNILIIGHDSTTRLHFRRQMNRTLAYLQDKNAIEFFGYTKVGENTLPNWVAALTGYDLNVYQNICTNGSIFKNYQDNCPFIWKDFDAANYLTTFLEDQADDGAFHFRKLGFFEQPVDFSVRPVILKAAMDSFQDYPEYKGFGFASTDCIGSNTNDQFILAYMKKLLKFSHLWKVPHFTFSFTTTSTHNQFNGLQLNDEDYAKFLEEVETKGYLKNTILFVLSDHGYRYGPIKQTIVGGYEENLPNFWVLLGPEVKENYPKWEKMLKINARRLTSPFNLYSTLRHIVETVSTSPIPQHPPQNITKVKRAVNASSIFMEVKEDSTCSDIGVEDQFCSCGLKRSLQLEDELTQAAGKFALAHLNGDLGKEESCMQLESRKIVGAVIKEPNTKNKTLITVSLLLHPGRIFAEATLYAKLNRRNQFDIQGVAHLQRSNRIKEDCHVDNDKLKQFCHCPAEPEKGRKRISEYYYYFTM